MVDTIKLEKQWWAGRFQHLEDRDKGHRLERLDGRGTRATCSVLEQTTTWIKKAVATRRVEMAIVTVLENHDLTLKGLRDAELEDGALVFLSLDLPVPWDAPCCHGNLSTHRINWQLFANPEDAGSDGANRGIACDEVDGGVADLADSLGNLRRGMYGPVTPLSERAAAEATETAA